MTEAPSITLVKPFQHVGPKVEDIVVRKGKQYRFFLDITFHGDSAPNGESVVYYQVLNDEGQTFVFPKSEFEEA